ncbi:sigma-70 family RNA polymerase sigma factor [Amycolatopsis decaplanina]|uniref:RNA polymerase factor sigma-70 n=1 Tax=Amycolatopsis decaplanina DSM 44594 TaxID=1284240 RepID=M2YAS5_9PSEU|nr:sigma-70 family RNA polymerase sigma factor [Amycolatopsis decaplanina]EME58710.1 RNA polymerase factor sigma-70 [Amycolatopsis decaplanina DSM 44594]
MRTDDTAFDRLVEPLRRELHAHCYRLLGSAHDADDALQDALLRAWRGMDRFESRSSMRTWLYTIVTRTCLDIAAARGKRALPMDLGPSSERVALDDAPATEVAWLGPYPDAPDVRYERREAIELAFVAALQHLPGNQRAALVLFEVLGFSAAEIASIMDTSVAAVNSALQRARAIVAEKVPSPGRQQTSRKLEDTRVREIAADFASALERGDADALVALLTKDVTWSMPPLRRWYSGIDAVSAFAVAVPLGRCPSWRTEVITANGQPAVACYLGESADTIHRAWSINVLSFRDDRIREITSFLDADLFAKFDLPPAKAVQSRDVARAAGAKAIEIPGADHNDPALSTGRS